MTSANRPALWHRLFLLAALEAGAALVVLLVVPREGLGFSSSRLAAIAFLLISFAASIYLAWRAPRWTDVQASDAWITVFGALSVCLSIVLFLLRYLDPSRLLPLYGRLSVLLWFLLAVTFQTLIVLIITRHGLRWETIRSGRHIPELAGVAFAVLLLLLGLVAVTGLGLTPDPAYWGEPGVPIFGWQLALAVLGGLGAFLLPIDLQRPHRGDFLLGISVWLVAVVLWLSVPIDVLQNSFYAPMRPPTGEPYPNSDAGYYDSMAQSLLIGHPYQGEIPSRPLYVVILAILHWILGENYGAIIAAQTALLALIPVLLFVLGRTLHGRSAGVVAAFIAIFREWTTLMVSSQTRVSNTKMLLADLPTLLIVLACAAASIRWLRHRRLRDAAIAGGTFGLLLLFRTQAAVIIPAAVLIALVVLGPRARSTYAQLALVLVMVGLTLAPWLLRNYFATGHLTLEADFQYRIIASQYRYTGNLDIQNVDLAGKGVAGLLVAFALRDPVFVLGFIANHFLATQIGGILVLPLVHGFAGLSSAVSLYWLDAPGLWRSTNIILVIAYLAVIALGIGSAWRRLRWLGLLPLAFSLAYSLGNGIARFSGWRYDLPADWSSYFYFAIGVASIIAIAAATFGRTSGESAEPQDMDIRRRPDWHGVVTIAFVFVVLGSLPWIAEQVATPRYGAQQAATLLDRLVSAPAVTAVGITRAQMESFLGSPEASLEIGRVLYPRFFRRGNGLASAHPWPAYAPRDYPRLGLILLNQTRHDVVFPSREAPGDPLHAVDAIIVGCQMDDHIEARLIYLVDTGAILTAAPLTESCR